MPLIKAISQNVANDLTDFKQFLIISKPIQASFSGWSCTLVKDSMS